MAGTIVDVAAELSAEADEIARSAVQNIRAAIPEYHVIPIGELHSSALRNTLRGIECLVAGRLPDEQATDPIETTRLRIEEGLRIDAIIRGYRVSLNALHSRFIELAAREQLDPDATLAGATLLWGLGDWFVNASIGAYRERVIDAEVRRIVEKSEVVHALTSGGRADATILDRARALGLDAAREYCVVLGSSRDLPPSTWVQRIERHARSGTAGAIAAVTARGAMGVVPRIPEAAAIDHPLAAGPFTSLDALSDSALVAANVLEAIGPESAGVFDIDSVGWRYVVGDHPELAAALSRKYLDPLGSEGEFGVILWDSAVAYIGNASSIRDGATALMIHENTLRYRITRFEALTGATLAHSDTAIEIAWLGEHRRRADSSG